jgi:hypothetical protein
LSVFGAGYGECLVLHLTENQWVVIDSCSGVDSGVSIATEYLTELKVPISSAVRLVVATHYHDDHIGALGEFFERSRSARFGCSMALRTNDWLTLLEVYRHYLQDGGSGVDQLRRVMKELAARAQRKEVAAPIFCIEGRVIREPILPAGAALTCLAPSDAAVVAMHAKIHEELLPRANRRRLRVPGLDRNDGAVVFSVQVGVASALLSADLEERNTPGLGWRVILDHLAPGSPLHDGFKIPHHGSPTGFHPEVWERLITKNGWAVVTPYNRQKNPLPGIGDCKRIAAMTNEAFITSMPGWARFRHLDVAVRKTAEETTLKIAPEQPKHGLVRFRRSVKPNENWKVELFENAKRLSEVLIAV